MEYDSRGKGISGYGKSNLIVFFGQKTAYEEAELLVGSEMIIRGVCVCVCMCCLLYTYDADDDLIRVGMRGRLYTIIYMSSLICHTPSLHSLSILTVFYTKFTIPTSHLFCLPHP